MFWSFFGPVAQPPHLLWLHFDFELLGITLDLQDVTTGTRWTPWLSVIRWIYPRTCNFAPFLAIFWPLEIPKDPPWSLQVDANMQASPPENGQLVPGTCAGCGRCGQPFLPPKMAFFQVLLICNPPVSPKQSKKVLYGTTLLGPGLGQPTSRKWDHF